MTTAELDTIIEHLTEALTANRRHHKDSRIREALTLLMEKRRESLNA